MANIFEIVGRVGLNTDRLKADTDKTASAMDDLGRRLAGALSIGALVSYGRAAVDAFGESERAAAKVEAGIRSMGREGEFSLATLSDKAMELSRASIFDDDTILDDVTANMLTFGRIGGEAFDRAQQAAIDLAAKMDGDLQGAAIMVGKALNEPIAGMAALSRVGIQLTADQKALIEQLVEVNDIAGAQDVILGELESQFGGTALAVANTSSGAMAQFANAVGNINEKVGGAIAEALNPLVDVALSVTSAFSKLDENSQTVIVILGLAAATATALALAFGPIAAAIGAVIVAGGLLYANWDKVVAFMTDAWLSWKLTFLSVVDTIITNMETFVLGVIERLRPIAGFLGIDLPEKVNFGSTAIKAAIASTQIELAALRTSQTDAAAASAAMAEEGRKLEERSVTQSAALRDTAAAAGEMGTALDSVPTPDYTPITTAITAIDLQGIQPVKASMLALPTTLDATMATLPPIATTYANQVRDEWLSAATSIHRGWSDAFEGPQGMLGGVNAILGTLNGPQGLSSGVMGLTALLGGSGGLAMGLGSIIGMVSGESGLTGGVAALANVAIPGLGTAITGVSSLLAQFGIDTDKILAGIASGVSSVVSSIGSALGLGKNYRTSAETQALYAPGIVARVNAGELTTDADIRAAIQSSLESDDKIKAKDREDYARDLFAEVQRTRARTTPNVGLGENYQTAAEIIGYDEDGNPIYRNYNGAAVPQTPPSGGVDVDVLKQIAGMAEIGAAAQSPNMLSGVLQEWNGPRTYVPSAPAAPQSINVNVQVDGQTIATTVAQYLPAVLGA